MVSLGPVINMGAGVNALVLPCGFASSRPSSNPVIARRPLPWANDEFETWASNLQNAVALHSICFTATVSATLTSYATRGCMLPIPPRASAHKTRRRGSLQPHQITTALSQPPSFLQFPLLVHNSTNHISSDIITMQFTKFALAAAFCFLGLFGAVTASPIAVKRNDAAIFSVLQTLNSTIAGPCAQLSTYPLRFDGNPV
jgi:hypothetical protein